MKKKIQLTPISDPKYKKNKNKIKQGKPVFSAEPEQEDYGHMDDHRYPYRPLTPPTHVRNPIIKCMNKKHKKSESESDEEVQINLRPTGSGALFISRLIIIVAAIIGAYRNVNQTPDQSFHISTKEVK